MPDPSAILRDMKAVDWIGSPPNAGTRARPGRMDAEAGVLFTADVGDSVLADTVPTFYTSYVDVALPAAGAANASGTIITDVDALILDIDVGVAPGGGTAGDLNYAVCYFVVSQTPGAINLLDNIIIGGYSGASSVTWQNLSGTYADWVATVYLNKIQDRLPIYLPAQSNIILTGLTTAGGAALTLRCRARGWARNVQGEPIKRWR